MSIDKRTPNVVNANMFSSPGPYIAKVINNVDPMKQGSLQVELMRPIGNQAESEQQLYTVRYLSPFYGVTNIDLNGTDNYDFNHTQKSYGFWAVPPDTGTLVMVIFVEGNPGQGYWMGCVQDAFMNHMVPGIAASESTEQQVRDSDETSWTNAKSTQEKYGTNFLPVGEINRQVFKKGGTKSPTPNPDVEANKKPVHPMADVLQRQGLLGDTVRGTHTSSARRESPSNVFGLSTPGPLDKRTNAQKGQVGPAERKINKFISRLGGHTIVMDDGNDRKLRKTKPWEGPNEYADLEDGETGGLVNFPQDETFRIRTRTGHQILLHNSEDLIYITNARGTAWIELTSNGKIDIFCQDSISVRTTQDYNIVAERDFNVHAGRSINFHAGSSFNIQSMNDLNIKCGANLTLSADTNLSLKGNNKINIEGDSALDLKTDRLRISSTTTDFLTSGNAHITAKSNIEIKSGTSTLITAGSNLYTLAGQGAFMQQNTLDVKTKGTTKITSSGAIDIKGEDLIHINAATDLHLLGKTGFLSSTETMNITGKPIKATSGSSFNITATSDNVMVKGDKIHLNGDDPAKADAASKADSAASSLQAVEAVSAEGAGSAKELTLFPLPGVGQVLVKRAPTVEPYAHHENFNPPGFTPTLTDREAADMPFSKDGPRLSIRRTSDADNVAAEYGGNQGWGGGESSGAGGGAANAAKQAESNPDSSSSYTGMPPTASQLAAWNSDWTRDQEFLGKASKLAGKYGLPLEHFLAFMHFETAHTMRPDKGNGCGYYGLIQFGEAACRDIGTTTGQIRQMSRAAQLDYVEKYFDLWIRKKGVSGLTLEKMYLLVALPAYVNKGPNEILAAQNGPNRDVWLANKGWRSPNNGPITPSSIGNAPKNCIAHVQAQLGSSKITS